MRLFVIVDELKYVSGGNLYACRASRGNSRDQYGEILNSRMTRNNCSSGTTRIVISDQYPDLTARQVLKLDRLSLSFDEKSIQQCGTLIRGDRYGYVHTRGH